MIKLDTTTRKIQAVLGDAVTTNQLHCTVSYSDDNGTTYVGGTQLTNTNSTTAVDICAAPGASTVRDIDYLSIRNRDTAAATVTVMLDDNTTDYEIVKATLAVGDQLVYTHSDGWGVIDTNGQTKTSGSGGASTLDDLTDVIITTPASGAVLTYNGSEWVDGQVSLSDGDAVTGQLPLANGGTGASLSDPNADRILFWDDSAGAITFLTAGSGLTITDTTITASGGGGISTPGGRLTLTSATPVLTSDVSASTSIYYALYLNDKVPLYDGSSWTMTTFTELTNTTTDNTKNPAAVGANSNYDLFVWSDSGTIRLGRGPAWTSDTARGTGAGTTELERVNGIWVNKIAITNGPAAQRGTYVGTVRSNGSSQIDCIFGGLAVGGTAGIVGVWNMYNRVPWRAFVGDTTDSWSYTTTTIRPANNSATMRVSYVAGFAEGVLRAAYPFFFTTSGSAPRVGVGHDSTSAFTTPQQLGLPSVSGPWPSPNIALTPSLGFHYLQALERGNTGATFYGDAGEPTLSQNGLTVTGTF